MLNESIHERHVGVPYEFRMFRSINVRHVCAVRQSLWATLKIQWRKIYHIDFPCVSDVDPEPVPIFGQCFNRPSKFSLRIRDEGNRYRPLSERISQVCVVRWAREREKNRDYRSENHMHSVTRQCPGNRPTCVFDAYAVYAAALLAIHSPAPPFLIRVYPNGSSVV